VDGAVDLQLDDLVHVVADFGEHLVGVLPVSGRAPGLVTSAVELDRRGDEAERPPHFVLDVSHEPVRHDLRIQGQLPHLLNRVERTSLEQIYFDVMGIRPAADEDVA